MCNLRLDAEVILRYNWFSWISWVYTPFWVFGFS